jgi:hypothetical protein
MSSVGTVCTLVFGYPHAKSADTFSCHYCINSCYLLFSG